MGRIYESLTLFDAMEERVEQYADLRVQLLKLKKTFRTIVDDTEFQGHGADAIKGFYEAHCDVVDKWLEFIEHHTAFLKSIPGGAEARELSGKTVVYEEFLNSSVHRGVQTARNMVDNQHDTLERILNSVSDLVSLTPFSTDTFNDLMENAQKKRADTALQVQGFDTELAAEYNTSLDAERSVSALFMTLMNHSRQGESISPIHFNAEAYRTDEIHQTLEKVKQDSTNYITFKKEQKKEREIAREIKEQESKPLLEKSWDTFCLMAAEVTGLNDTKRAVLGVDPVTGKRLSTSERISAGAMAVAGYIPVIGWGGRAVKGVSTGVKAAKGMKATTNTLDAYKHGDAWSYLQKAEYGIYGAVSANGFSEYFRGEDLLGNKLTDEQRQQSLINAFTIMGVTGAAAVLDKVPVKKFVRNQAANAKSAYVGFKTDITAQVQYAKMDGKEFAMSQTANAQAAYRGLKTDIAAKMQYAKVVSKEYAQAQVEKANAVRKAVANRIYKIELPVPELKVMLTSPVGTGGQLPLFDYHFNVNKITVGEMVGKKEVVNQGGSHKPLSHAPRMKEIEVHFNRNIKHDPEEFARQLKDQEIGMNELTVDEYLKNRGRYIAKGRAIEGNAAQQTAREEALFDKITILMDEGKSFDEAEKEAKAWLNTQAALHNPDQIAGGMPENIGGMGDKGINSSIGSQWRYRIDIVDEQIREIAKKMTSTELKNTYLNVKLIN
ncbi:polymorphic toxin type 15 domain-containing protein [Fictibacillus iocasae]|uniref:Polymorphic toxin type 15 domain-containing protein n=1 Tax=Fictibacillus iocasae TaxID=2715437 RepID=A0ABW2NLQ3_9BACL